MDMKKAVPFMCSVAPRGKTNPETSRGTPSSSSAARIVMGRVAAELAVEKAVTIGTRAPAKKRSGLTPAKSRTKTPNTPNW